MFGILDTELWLGIHSHYMSMEIPEELRAGGPHKHPGVTGGSGVSGFLVAFYKAVEEKNVI